MSCSGESAEAVVAASVGRRAERERVLEDMAMSRVMRQMPVRAGRAGAAGGEAVRESASDETRGPRQEHRGAGSVLLQAVLTRENLQRAWKRVRANKGAAGVDGLDIDQTAARLKTEWPTIRDSLLRGRYRPAPVRRVLIAKPDGGERELGLPAVTDRRIQQALLQVLQPLIDPSFSEHSYGFRPGRRAHCFVRYADDCNVYVRSRRAGERVMALLRRLYGKLKLKVNEAKSAVAGVAGRKFLGYSFWFGKGGVHRRVATKALLTFKQRVRELTRRSGGRSMAQVVERLRAYLLGWKAYFRLAQTPRVWRTLDEWLRHRLRAI